MFSKTLSLTGNSGTLSTTPWVVDVWPNSQSIGVNCNANGTVTFSLQGSYDDFSPQWDLVNNTASWENITNFTALTASANGTITGGPYTMIRLTTTSGTGTVTAKFIQSYAGRTI